MAANLNTETVRSLVSPGGNDDLLVSAIFLNQQKKVFARLVQVCKILLEQAPELSKTVSLRESYGILVSSPKGVQVQILSSPSAIYWLNLSSEMINREWHIKFPHMHIESHLQKFKRFAVAALVLSGSNRDLEFRLRTNSRGMVALPGLSQYIADTGNSGPFRDVDLAIQDGRLTSSTEGIAVLDNEPVDGFLQLNDYDELLELGGTTGFTVQKLDPQAELSWKECLKHSLEWIRETNEQLYGEIRRNVKTIFPVVSASPSVHISATFREAAGLMALSWTPDVSVMTEAMVHEYHHQKLNALLEVDPLISGPTSEPVFYSPWRTDPRPLLGLFHGAYVFQAILAFWVKFISGSVQILDNERVKQRMFLIYTQTRLAIESLKLNGEFTNLGQALLEAMNDSLGESKSRLPTLSESVTSQILNYQQQHQNNWEKQFSRLPRTLEINRDVSKEPSDSSTLYRWLGLETNFSADAMLSTDYPDDILMKVILEKVGTDEEWEKTLMTELGQPAEDLGKLLLRAHYCYVRNAFSEAGQYYSRCIALKPQSAYLWECLAFAFRHQDNWDLSKKILDNLDHFTTQKYESAAAVTNKIRDFQKVTSEFTD